MSSSVSTGYTILPLSSSGTCILWNRRLVFLLLFLTLNSNFKFWHFIIQNIYFSISFFNCTPLFCGFMLKFWYFISAIIFVWTVIFPSWSAIVYCCLLIVSIKVLIELSTHDGCLFQSFVKITLYIYNSNMCSTCLKRVQH